MVDGFHLLKKGGNLVYIGVDVVGVFFADTLSWLTVSNGSSVPNVSRLTRTILLASWGSLLEISGGTSQRRSSSSRRG